MLLDYGFVPARVDPVAEAAFALDDGDLSLDEKELVLADYAGLLTEVRYALSEEDPLPEELLAFLRLKNMRGADTFLLEPVFLDTIWGQHLQLPVSEENERDALQDVADFASAVLERFAEQGNSVQTDLQTLAEADRAGRPYALSAVRYAERRALETVLRAAQSRQGNLKGANAPEYYQERRLNAMGLQPMDSDEIEAMRSGGEASGIRAGGRTYTEKSIDW
jgi:hypothetical protein